MGIIKWHQSPDHSLDRICPLTSSSCSRCMMTMSGDCFGLFNRVVESSFHHVRAVLRSASLSASSVLWGSSTTMMSPPIPSNEPPTDVASLEPPTLVSNFVFVFWSSQKLKRCPHSDWYHGLRMSRRVELLLVSDKSWLYEPHRKRTCGPFRNIRCDCAHTHAGKKIEATVVFAHLGGKFTSRCLISPFTTACRCSHNASIAQQRLYSAGSIAGHAASTKSIKLASSRCASSSLRPSAAVASSSARRARTSSRRLSINQIPPAA